MNKIELITCIRESKQLSFDQIDELESIVNRYPYFLTARLLLAKVSKDQQHHKTKEYLSSAAIYSTDRVLLKKYLSGKLIFLHKPNDSNVGTSLKKQKNTLNVSNVVEYGNFTASPDILDNGLDALLEELQRDMENLKSSRKKFIEVQEKIIEEEVNPTTLKEISSSHSDSQHPQEKHSKENKTAILTEKITEQALEAARKAKEEVAREDEKIAKKKKLSKKKNNTETIVISNPVIKSNKAQNTENTKISYSSTASKINSKKTSILTTAEDKTSDDHQSITEKDDDNTNSKFQKDIIDKFIKKSPVIKPQQKNEDHDVEDLSKQSSSWDHSLISEHLAEIHLHQGNKSRATEIYTALMLKYPEKKSYFANLISKLT